MKRPSQFFVRYSDSDLYEKAVARAGGNPDHIDGLDYWLDKDFPTMRAADQFARTGIFGAGGAQVMERTGITEDEFGWWDFDERVVTEY